MTGLPDSPVSSVSRDTDARDFHREQLSAMMDGALSADETKFLLRRMEHDDALADCWERWQFVGDALRGQTDRALPADFSRRVGRAIADDLAAVDEAPLAVAAHGNARGSLLRWGGGAALAASVALAALIGTRMLSVPDGKSSTAASTASVPAQTLSTTPVPSTPSLVPEAVGAPSLPPAQPGPLLAEAATAVAIAAVAGGDRRSARPRILARDQAVAVSSTATTKAVGSAAGQSAVVANAAAQGSSGAAHTEMISKPWPRALVPGATANGDVTAGFEGSPAFHPFQPRLEPQVAHPVEDTASPP
jgi:negative regulator of sigma E activity